MAIHSILRPCYRRMAPPHGSAQQPTHEALAARVYRYTPTCRQGRPQTPGPISPVCALKLFQLWTCLYVSFEDIDNINACIYQQQRHQHCQIDVAAGPRALSCQLAEPEDRRERSAVPLFYGTDMILVLSHHAIDTRINHCSQLAHRRSVCCGIVLLQIGRFAICATRSHVR